MGPNSEPDTNNASNPFVVLLDIIDRASTKVPVVKYAFGLAGIAASGAIIAAILGTGRSAIIIMTLTFVGSILLFVFAKFSLSSSRSVQSAGIFLIWVVVSFFSTFLLFTTTAFTAAWPEPWAKFLGIDIPNYNIERQKQVELCNERIRVMFNMLNNQNNQTTDTAQMADLVEGCNQVAAETVRGSLAFYSGNYHDAVVHFEKAVSLRKEPGPRLDPLKRDLADSYLEVGRIDDALKIYQQVTAKDELWSYKIAKAYFYNNHLDEALSIIQSVKPDLNEDGNLLGRPRVLQAAILIEKAKTANVNDKNAIIKAAHNNFDIGYNLDQEAWRKILKVTFRTRNEGYSKEAVVLAPYLDKWTSKAGKQ